jgi:hypothetical protein
MNTAFGKSIISLLTLSYSTLSAIKTSINIDDLLEKKLNKNIESGCEITYQDYVKPIIINRKLKLDEKKIALIMTRNYVINNKSIFYNINNHRLDSLIKRKIKEIKK